MCEKVNVYVVDTMRQELVTYPHLAYHDDMEDIKTQIVKIEAELRDLKRQKGSVDDADDAPRPGRVYVGNLLGGTTAQDLQKHMQTIGPCLHFEILDAFKGSGVVEYRTAAEAQRALKELDGTELMRRNIRVCQDRGKLAGEQFEALTREISALRTQLQAEENEGERQAQQKSLDELRAVHDAFKQDVQDAVAVTTAKDQIYALNQSLEAVKTLQEGLRGSLLRVRFTQVSSIEL